MISKQPIYQTIIDALILELNSNRFKKNDAFYSENEIRNKYHVSSTTAVRVLNTLATQGYIHRVQGRGSFVSKFNLGTAVKITDTRAYDQDHEEVAVLAARSVQGASEHSRFKDTDSLWYFERLREIQEIPFEYSQSWYLQNLIANKVVQHPRQIHSIYQVIRQHTGWDLLQQPFHQDYSVVQIPSQRIADFLHVDIQTTVVRIERWVFDHDTPLEYTLSYLLPNYFGLHVTSDTNRTTANLR